MPDKKKEHTFSATLEIIGVNPFVRLPELILNELFIAAGRDKGPIPIHGKINDRPYTQTLMKFRGLWRLYVNMTMLKDSPKRIGETVHISVSFDHRDRSISMHPKLAAALESSPEAKAVFERQSISLQKEIIRYIAHLKSEDSVDRNVHRAIQFLLGKERFVGRAPVLE
ncbi:MAG: YdeI/OmpD-associated family protein [Flavobacteriales bacterium]